MINPNTLENKSIKYNEDCLKKLYDYEILGTPEENSFNTFSLIAKELFDAEKAFISFNHGDTFFLKAFIPERGAIELTQIEIFCKQASLNDEVTIFESPFFFLSAPIISPEGYVVGSIGVTNSSFINITQKQLVMLKSLSALITDKLEMRMATRKTLRAYDNRMHMIVHDLKNPMTTISLQSELMGRMPGVDEKTKLIAGKINNQAKMMIDNLNFILTAAKRGKESFKPQKIKIDLNELFNDVKTTIALTLQKKNQKLSSNIPANIEIFGEWSQLAGIFSNVIDNASKFSPSGTAIHFSAKQEDNLITFSIEDEGNGLSSENLDLLFVKFASLDSIATAKENSNGLGLTVVKSYIDMHKGKIWAESKGKNLGTTFYIELPVK